MTRFQEQYGKLGKWPNLTPHSRQILKVFKGIGKLASINARDDKFQYTLIPDSNIEIFLQATYGEVPLIIEAFKTLPNNILKADFFRYLILFARGGIYSDIDTVPLKDLSSWPSLKGDNWKSTATQIPYKGKLAKDTNPPEWNEPGLVIGIEADPDRDDWKTFYARRLQFCQWTIQAKPGHPVLRELILNITATTLNSVKTSGQWHIDSKFKKDYNVNWRDRRGQDSSYDHSKKKCLNNVDGTDIMNWTGPGIFSDIIFQYMSNLIQQNNDILLINDNLNQDENETNLMKSTTIFYKKIMDSLQLKGVVPWEFFGFLKQPVLVDDIMVLPITSFSPDVGQMEAGTSSDSMAFVKHMFEGSWKEEADSKNSS